MKTCHNKTFLLGTELNEMERYLIDSHYLTERNWFEEVRSVFTDVSTPI